MVLPLLKAPRGYLRLTYSGPVGDIATQSWDLTQFPEYIRADPSFKTSLLLFVKGGAGLTAVSDVVSFFPAVGTPTSLVLSLTAADVADEISLDVWCLHSIVGGVVDGPKLYFMGGGGGGSTSFGEYLPALTLGDNVDSVGSVSFCPWTRVGDIVTVNGTIGPFSFSAPLTESIFKLSLPIATGADSTLTGLANGPENQNGRVFGDLGEAQFFLFPTGVNTLIWVFMFTYRVA